MGKRIALIVFLALPLLIVAGLMWFIAASLERQGRTTGPGGAEPMSFVPAAAPAASDQPEDGVQPETLPQGFIIIADDLQRLADANSPISLGTNFGNWHPGHAEFTMSPRSDGRWQLILEKPTEPGRMQFKFTRGTWETVELDSDNEQIANRVLPTIDPAEYADGSRPVFEFTIDKWADQLPGATQQRGIEDTSIALDVTGTAKRLQVVGGAGRAAGMVRDAIVWLPPGYESGDQSYPVLYMMDGQNVFMQQPGTPGEWHADETATELIESGAIEPMIIVGVPHSAFSRADEYLPVALIDGVQPSADEFVSWLEHSVMPRVERAFRVETGPEHTGIGGASFGGVFAMHAASTRPDLFGKALVESPSLLSSNAAMLTAFTADGFAWPETLFLGMGEHEAGQAADADALNERYLAGMRSMIEAAEAAGVDLAFEVGKDHVHNEQAWAERLPQALKHLYGR
ncbi:MAG: alpha/beta hydrolase-fold protein [Planctomycetota bacterium]